jgi:hypothetical protein
VTRGLDLHRRVLDGVVRDLFCRPIVSVAMIIDDIHFLIDTYSLSDRSTVCNIYVPYSEI